MAEIESKQSFEVSILGHELGFDGMVRAGHLAKVLETFRWQMGRSQNHPVLSRFKAGVLRAQTIELYDDIGMGAELRVEVFLSRVGRTSLDFESVIFSKGGKKLGHSLATIVAIGENGPEPLPPELKDFVHPGDMKHPELGELEPAKAYQRSDRVRPSDLDLFRHMNQSRYVDFADDARLLAHADGHEAGFTGPLGLVFISYEDEVRLGQELDVLLELLPDGSRRFGLRRAGETKFVTNGLVRGR